MQHSTIENFRRCVAWYLEGRPVRAAGIGLSDMAAACKALLPEDSTLIPDPGATDFDLVLAVAGDGPDHGAAVARLLSPGGLAFVAGAEGAGGPGMRLVHAWSDPRGARPERIAVWQKGGSLTRRMAPPAPRPLPYLAQAAHPDPAAERTSGARPYLDVLAEMHAILAPRAYLEIGIRHGASLALARCPAIGIDPQPAVTDPAPGVAIHAATSDDFFFFDAPAAIGETRFDLAFIDGMHLCEFVLDDFLNVERVMAPGGVIVIDDVLPNHPVQAQRDRQSRVWTGDVWRIAPALAAHRPDLRLTWLDTAPVGMLVIGNLDPANRRLWQAYETIRAAWAATPDEPPPAEVIGRRMALPPDRASILRAVGR